MIYWVKNRDYLKNLEQLPDLQSKVKQVRFIEKLSKQSFHYDIKEVFEPISKLFTDTSQKLLDETKSTTREIEELDESNVPVKAFELSKKDWVRN